MCKALCRCRWVVHLHKRSSEPQRHVKGDGYALPSAPYRTDFSSSAVACARFIARAHCTPHTPHPP